VLFTVLDVDGPLPANASEQAFLVRDNWNDWFDWWTMLTLVVFDERGNKSTLGSVKIGRFGMTPGVTSGTIDLPRAFEELDDTYFSLGQSDDYYAALYAVSGSLRLRIISGLHDVAVDLNRFARAKDEPVMQRSLLRQISEQRVRGRFNRLAAGNADLTRFAFDYSFPQLDTTEAAPLISFEVLPDSRPPTNIHVLIGRNGVGKTRRLQQMSLALLSGESTVPELGTFRSMDAEAPFATILGAPQVPSRQVFGNLVSVTFSAFDPFEPIDDNKEERLALPYSYVGLKGGSKVSLSSAIASLLKPPGPETSTGISRPKNVDELAGDFGKSAAKCRLGSKVERWRRALEALETDPLFREANVTSLAIAEDDPSLDIRAMALYRRLSSGHKIVLLTITRLVETVEEKTLILLDEPEAHLHPPLLAAFVRSLSDLLIKRNGVAIVATHSPVVLQEVPKNCVWILGRSGRKRRVDRPELETFGENVGILTREVFGLEVTKSGFHELLDRIVTDSRLSYEAIVDRFGGQLGAEARAIIRGMIADRDEMPPSGD
jgi:hypothetical protein